MGDISIKGKSPILRQGYKDGGRAGFSVGSSVGRHLKKGVGLLKEHLARKEAKKVQGAKDKIQKSEMGYAKGGRAGFKNGKSVFRRNPDRLEFTGKHGAKGAIPWNRKFKKRLSISDSPRQPKMLQPFKNGGSSMPEHYLQHGYGPHKKRKRKAIGGPAARGAQKSANRFLERVGGGEKGKPHSTKEGRIASGKRKLSRLLQRYSDKSNYKNPRRKFPPEKPTWSDMPRKPLEKGKYQPLKKGGKSDKKWIQKATASIKKRKTKGKCTPITKPGCTGRAKALAKTFKKMAKKRKAA